VLLSGVNYINHLSCYRRGRLLAIGGLRAGYDGSQDYELVLRYLRDLKPEEIKHLPYPAYQWRRNKTAFSTRFLDQAIMSARKALSERYRQGDFGADVDEALTKPLHRVRFDRMQNRWPLVSVIIPSKDAFRLISRVLSELTTKTDYPDMEIIVVDNGTTDSTVLALYERYERSGIRFKSVLEPAPFNFARQVNKGLDITSGELVLLLNNDVQVLESKWLREMVSCFKYPKTGIVGARLLYPNRRLQHAGVIVGLGGLAGHWFNGWRSDYAGPMARLHVRQSFTALTAACMLISRMCLQKVGHFNEHEFGVAYNDVDFCMRAVAKGFGVVWTPFATLIHQESATRGSDKKGVNLLRFEQDKRCLRECHKTDTFEDRAYNPWCSRNWSEPLPISLTQLPRAR
jgi:O-antigen biosynthesis protein